MTDRIGRWRLVDRYALVGTFVFAVLGIALAVLDHRLSGYVALGLALACRILGVAATRVVSSVRPADDGAA